MRFKSQTLPIHAGELFLFPPHVPHQFLPAPASATRHLYLGFSLGGGFPPLPTDLDSPVLDQRHALKMTGPLGDLLAAVEAKRDKSLLERRAGDVLSILLGLLADLVSGVESDASDTGRAALLAEKVKAYLAANLNRRISVRELAASFYLSPHYFGECFKQHTGMTLKAYHHFMRLEAAADRLRDPDVQVSEVADQLGFGSIHYFSRKFKAHFGVSPSTFRER